MNSMPAASKADCTSCSVVARPGGTPSPPPIFAPRRRRPHAYWIAPEPEPQPVHLSMQVLTQVLHASSQGVFGGKHLKIQAAEHAPEHAAICPVPPHELA